MQYTEHLKLPLYESEDPALLTDGYDNAMHLIDNAFLGIRTDISTIQQTLALITEKLDKKQDKPASGANA